MYKFSLFIYHVYIEYPLLITKESRCRRRHTWFNGDDDDFSRTHEVDNVVGTVFDVNLDARRNIKVSE